MLACLSSFCKVARVYRKLHCPGSGRKADVINVARLGASGRLRRRRMTLTLTTALEGAPTDVPALERLLARHVAGARHLRWSGAELVRSVVRSQTRCRCIFGMLDGKTG